MKIYTFKEILEVLTSEQHGRTTFKKYLNTVMLSGGADGKGGPEVRKGRNPAPLEVFKGLPKNARHLLRGAGRRYVIEDKFQRSCIGCLWFFSIVLTPFSLQFLE